MLNQLLHVRQLRRTAMLEIAEALFTCDTCHSCFAEDR
jgi:hypothetical protein